MRRIDRHLGLASNVMISNVWLLETPSGERILVDTGHVSERWALRYALWRAGIRDRGDLQGVLLTHRHSDHAGNAAWLRSTFGCPVYCHPADAAHLAGDAKAPRLARRETFLPARLLCMFEDRFPARTPIDGTFDEPSFQWDFRVFPTPGHTEGSTLLFHEPTRTLFTGDSVLTGIALLRPFRVMGFAKAEFSEDVARSHENARRALRAMPKVDTVCAGHGPPTNGDALLQLLQR